ncbi:MAG: hypothetical protein WBF90_33930 [Rivularia sp. (in: cyanobacteria)]
MQISLLQAAKLRQEVFFYFAKEAANKNTIPGQFEYIYAAIFCADPINNSTEYKISYYTYPYGLKDTNWFIVSRVFFDYYHSKIKYFTTLQEALNCKLEIIQERESKYINRFIVFAFCCFLMWLLLAL